MIPGHLAERFKPPENPLRFRQGTIVSVQNDTATLTVTLAGSSVPISGVHYTTGVTPLVGAAVWLATDGRDLFAVGTLVTPTLGGGLQTASNGERIVVNVPPLAWAASTAFAQCDHCLPSTANGFAYEATCDGTTGSSEPTWPTTPGQTVVDGGVTWSCVTAPYSPAAQFFTGASGEWKPGILRAEMDGGRTRLWLYSGSNHSPDQRARLSLGDNMSVYLGFPDPASIVQIDGLLFPVTAVAGYYGNGWTDYGSPYVGGHYCMTPDSFVHLWGEIKGGTVGSAAFILPTDCRPAGTLLFAVASNSGFGQVTIDSSGNVKPISPCNNSSVSLSGISFRAAA